MEKVVPLVVLDFEKRRIEPYPQREVIDNVRRAAKYWRSEGMPVIFTRNARFTHLVVAPKKGETKPKPLQSLFSGTDFEHSFSSAGVTQFALCGQYPHLCLAESTKHGLRLGFRIDVIKDACNPGLLADSWERFSEDVGYDEKLRVMNLSERIKEGLRDRPFP